MPEKADKSKIQQHQMVYGALGGGARNAFLDQADDIFGVHGHGVAASSDRGVHIVGQPGFVRCPDFLEGHVEQAFHCQVDTA